MIPHTRSSSQLPPRPPGRITSLQIRGYSRFIRKQLPENGKSPAVRSFPSSETSAELSSNESRDPTTEGLRVLCGLGLRQHADDRLGAGRPHEDTALVRELGVHTLYLLGDRGSQSPVHDH